MLVWHRFDVCMDVCVAMSIGMGSNIAVNEVVVLIVFSMEAITLTVSNIVVESTVKVGNKDRRRRNFH